MNHINIVLFVSFAICSMVNGQQRRCTTITGGEGECKSLFECPPLFALINNKNKTPQDVELLRRSHCGFEKAVPAVCCSVEIESRLPPIPRCYTPEGKPGECTSLTSCPDLANLLKPPVPSENLQYVERSKCLGSQDYSVCCGPVPNLKNVETRNCAAKVSAFPPDPRTECCGVDGYVGNRIYGGGPTAIDQYPWLALIEYVKEEKTRTLCGGALISGKYVLTAAHCVVGEVMTLGRYKNVRLGEYDTSHEGPDVVTVENVGTDMTDGAIRIPIEKAIPHPQYNPDHPQKKHDIALIRMKEMAPYTDFIRPICLPTANIALNTKPFNVTVAGWGAVSSRLKSSPVKLHVELPFVIREQCQNGYRAASRNITLWEGHICAGGEPGKDACKGDSGGPLMYQNGKIYEAIGLVSFGPRDCGSERVPGVYTNLYKYGAWIRSNLAP